MNELQQLESKRLFLKAEIYEMDAKKTNNPLNIELLLAKRNLIILQLEQNGYLRKTSLGFHIP